jgi:hypothetical protein
MTIGSAAKTVGVGGGPETQITVHHDEQLTLYKFR